MASEAKDEEAAGEASHVSGLVEPLLAKEKNGKPAEKEKEEPDDDEAAGASVGVFKNNVLMACRTAFACVLVAIPVLIPDMYKAIDPMYSALLGGGVALMVPYTVFANLGCTIQLAWQGFIGTFWACVPTHIVCALMPYGAAGASYHGPTVHAVNIISIFLGLFLNVSKNIRLFAVCYHVYFIMEVMNPDSTVVNNTTWMPEWDTNTVATLVTAGLGMVVAVFAMMIPTCIRASTVCRTQGSVTVTMLTDLVDGLVKYYAREEPSVRIVQLQEVAVGLRKQIEGMQVNIDAMWWETFDIGRAGRSRALLTRHRHLMQKMSDTVFSLQVCISKEDFGNTHIQLLNKISPQVDALVAAAKELLVVSTTAASDGHVDKNEEAEMRTKIEALKSSVADLAVTFNDARKEISPDQRITAHLQSESFYVYCLSVYARRIMDYAQDMLDRPPRSGSSELPNLMQELWSNWRSVFDPEVIIMDPDYRSFTMRNTLSVVLAYYVGFYYLGYSGVPAGTVAVLISNFQGSALQKNLNRLQAVTLSKVLPFIIIQAMGTSCALPRLALQFFIIFAWELLTAYIYYSSATFGYVGCLLAGMGAPALICPCSDDPGDATAPQIAAYTQICQTTIAVICMTCVDLWLASTTAAELAADNFKIALLAIDAYFQACLVKRKPNGECQKGHIVERLKVEVKDRSVLRKVGAKRNYRSPGKIFDHLTRAEVMCNEANLEPRYYRTPWPMDFFCNITKAAHVLRANLLEFEHVLRGVDCTYTDIFACCRDTVPFTNLHNDIVNTMDECLTMVDTILKNDLGKPIHSALLRLNKLEKIDKLEDMQALFDELNKMDNPALAYPEKAPPTLEMDLLCRLNVVFMIMESTIEKVSEVLKECVKELS